MYTRYVAYTGNAIIKYTLHHNYCLCHGYKHQPLAGKSRRSGYPTSFVCERRPYCSGHWAWRMETELGRRPDPKQVGPRRRLIAELFFFFLLLAFFFLLFEFVFVFSFVPVSCPCFSFSFYCCHSFTSSLFYIFLLYMSFISPYCSSFYRLFYLFLSFFVFLVLSPFLQFFPSLRLSFHSPYVSFTSPLPLFLFCFTNYS